MTGNELGEERDNEREEFEVGTSSWKSVIENAVLIYLGGFEKGKGARRLSPSVAT